MSTLTPRRPRPDLRHERALLRSGARVVVGMDEVGRGALAGPVSVGAVAVDLMTRTCPSGVADSKLLTPGARRRLLPALGRWGVARAVGHASPAEIDQVGIVAALRLAGGRALAALGVAPDVVLLDGSHDWLSPPLQPDLFAEVPEVGFAVRTRVKADQRCASVAAASVLAKCERDDLMVALDAAHPEYGWCGNKGYGAPEHVEALRRLGPCPEHRRSWRLPVMGEVGEVGEAACAEAGVESEPGTTATEAVVAVGAEREAGTAAAAGVRPGDGPSGASDAPPGWVMMDA
ncbi:ribonuclease HII [Actinotalea sp. AC32]|nr:ribonuclease HII [Actinotalea sp. AC32]